MVKLKDLLNVEESPQLVKEVKGTAWQDTSNTFQVEVDGKESDFPVGGIVRTLHSGGDRRWRIVEVHDGTLTVTAVEDEAEGLRDVRAAIIASLGEEGDERIRPKRDAERYKRRDWRETARGRRRRWD